MGQELSKTHCPSYSNILHCFDQETENPYTFLHISNRRIMNKHLYTSNHAASNLKKLAKRKKFGEKRQDSYAQNSPKEEVQPEVLIAYFSDI
jgi:hypothetical protein